jgi:hypothetical protein
LRRSQRDSRYIRDGSKLLMLLGRCTLRRLPASLDHVLLLDRQANSKPRASALPAG